MKVHAVRISLAALLLTAACTSTSSGSPQPGTRLPTAESCVAGTHVSTSKLLNLTLPCLTGAKSEVLLADLPAKPTLITLWAHWCEPCAKELPSFQRVSETGKLYVLGVNSIDDAEKAVPFAQDFKLSFPSVFDANAHLLDNLVKAGKAVHSLPATIFINAQGDVVHVFQGGAYSDKTLKADVLKYLGVAL